jgi:hypothetical protein
MDGDANKNCQKKQTGAERLNSVKDDDVNGYVMETLGGRTGPATKYPVRRTFSGTNNCSEISRSHQHICNYLD